MFLTFMPCFKRPVANCSQTVVVLYCHLASTNERFRLLSN